MKSYSLIEPVDRSRDYLATGELSPIAPVSGGRMRRHLTLNGFRTGFVYVHSEALIGPNYQTILKASKVSFSLSPYERNHRNLDYQAMGETGLYSVPLNEDLSDYELWNSAAAALHQASDSLSLQFNNPRNHFTKGRWRCGFVGNSGRDTVWQEAKTVSPGLLRSSASNKAHFLAQDTAGASYRLVPEWQTMPDTMGQFVGLHIAAIHCSGPTASLPNYLIDWVKSRIPG